MNRQTSEGGLGISGRIDTQVHKTEDLQDAVDGYDDLSDSEKLSVIRDTEPMKAQTTYNVTLTRFHEYFVDNLDRNNTNPEANVTIEYLALGDDGAGGSNSSNTDLNNRLYSQEVTDVADNGVELVVSTFIGSGDGNGNTFDELGLFTGDPASMGNDEVFMVNHTAGFGDIGKTSDTTVTFDVTLSFSDA